MGFKPGYTVAGLGTNAAGQKIQSVAVYERKEEREVPTNSAWLAAE